MFTLGNLDVTTLRATGIRVVLIVSRLRGLMPRRGIESARVMIIVERMDIWAHLDLFLLPFLPSLPPSSVLVRFASCSPFWGV